MDISRQSAWRSETEDSLNCSGQCAIGFPGRGPNDSRAGSVPIPGIFPTHDIARKKELSTSVTEASGATGNQAGFIRLCAGPKTGCTSAADWIEEIISIWAKNATNTLELARIVFRARRSMRYGAWARIWGTQQLPFAISKAKMLVRIGERLGDLDGQTFGHLPAGWSILYILSLLGTTTVKRLVEEGIIHRKLTLREAKELVARLSGKRTEARMRKASLRLWLRRSVEFVRNNKSDWKLDERELVTEELTRLMEEINAVERAIFKGSPSTFITQLGLLTDPPIKL